MLQCDFTSIFCLITDILIFIAVNSWFLASRSVQVPSFIKIISSGVLLFAIVDMFYYYLYFHNLYIPNSLIDFAYILSFAVVAFGVLQETYRQDPPADTIVLTDTGKTNRWAYLFLFPATISVLEVTDVIEIDLNLIDLATFFLLIILYYGFSKYIQLSLENARLLKVEQRNN
jgi:hypothetical protein